MKIFIVEIDSTHFLKCYELHFFTNGFFEISKHTFLKCHELHFLLMVFRNFKTHILKLYFFTSIMIFIAIDTYFFNSFYI